MSPHQTLLILVQTKAICGLNCLLVLGHFHKVRQVPYLCRCVSLAHRGELVPGDGGLPSGRFQGSPFSPMNISFSLKMEASPAGHQDNLARCLTRCPPGLCHLQSESELGRSSVRIEMPLGTKGLEWFLF